MPGSAKLAREVAGLQRAADLPRRALPETELTATRNAYVSAQQSAILAGSNVSVASRPTLPSSPAQPRPKLYLALGLVVALLLATGTALLRNLFDERVRDEDELLTLMHAPIIARVPVARPGRDLATQEALDVLGVNLRAADPLGGRQVIAVTSALPNDGKTTLVAALGLGFARLGMRVATVDCDLRRRALTEAAGALGAAGVANLGHGAAGAIDQQREGHELPVDGLLEDGLAPRRLDPGAVDGIVPSVAARRKEVPAAGGGAGGPVQAGLDDDGQPRRGERLAGRRPCGRCAEPHPLGGARELELVDRPQHVAVTRVGDDAGNGLSSGRQCEDLDVVGAEHDVVRAGANRRGDVLDERPGPALGRGHGVNPGDPAGVARRSPPGGGGESHLPARHPEGPSRGQHVGGGVALGDERAARSHPNRRQTSRASSAASASGGCEASTRTAPCAACAAA